MEKDGSSRGGRTESGDVFLEVEERVETRRDE